MEKNSLLKDFIKYTSLNVLGMIGLSCYILADTFFIARGLGSNGLTALNLAIPIYGFINGAGLMTGMGSATRFSISKDEKIFTQALYLGFILALFMVITGVFFSNQLSALLGADSITHQMTASYLQIILCFSPAFILNNILLCFVRNDNSPKLSMIAMVIGSFSNIWLDYVFIFPLQMGMTGAALATGVAPVISLLVLSIHFLRKHNTFQLYPIMIKRKALLDISFLGVSSLITELSSGTVIIVFNMIILNLAGNTGVAAYGIIANIALVIIAIFTGISQGMQPVISKNYGQEEFLNVKKVFIYGLLTAVVFSIAIYIITFLNTSIIVEIFNKDQDIKLAGLAENGLRIYFIGFLWAGVNILTASYFSATDTPKQAFIISMLRGFIVIIPAAIILSHLFELNGVWMAFPVSESIVFFISLIFFRKSKLFQAKTEEGTA